MINNYMFCGLRSIDREWVHGSVLKFKDTVFILEHDGCECFDKSCWEWHEVESESVSAYKEI